MLMMILRTSFSLSTSFLILASTYLIFHGVREKKVDVTLTGVFSAILAIAFIVMWIQVTSSAIEHTFK